MLSARSFSHWCIGAAWAAAALLSTVSAARASDRPAIRLEDVFPPGRSVCAGIPLHAGHLSARPDTAAAALDHDECDTLWRPDEDKHNGDVRFLRWRHVRARPLSREIPLEIRSGTVGLTVHAEARTEQWNISVELLGPDGNLLACEECVDAPAVGEVRPGQGTTQMPSTDRPGWPLTAGRYAFRVRATPADSTAVGDGTTVDVIATLHTTSSVVLEKRLDLNFVYLPGCALSADIAETSPRFATFLAKLEQWMAPTGIRIGRVTHVDLDRPEFSVIATWDEAGELFRTSCEVGRARALNIYCLQGFEAPLNPVVGLSGGVPGPVGNGTTDSGIAIRTQPFFTCTDCLDAFASLTAHEIGHYLGFYHTTEADLEHWDPFLDTPECHDVALNDCPDHDYVMFPLIHVANHIWSPDQARMAWTHPMVRTVAVVGRRDAEEPPGSNVVASPNPFAGQVRFALPSKTGGSRVSIYDVAGRLVRRLEAQSGELVWDGLDDARRPSPTGIYFARAFLGNEPARMIRLVKVR